MASINYDTDVITSLAGQNSTVYGIAKGYASGNLGYVANQYNGIANDGEFTVTGTSFTPNKLVIARKYYSAGGRAAEYSRVAMREAGTLSYLLSDHLGSNAIVADTLGVRTSEVRYKAWGEDRYVYGTSPTSYRYTGQRAESSIGLYFYGARWYDAALGRFTSADTIVPNPGDPAAWDRYAYVRNSPIRYIDPSGHGYCDSENQAESVLMNCKMTAQAILGLYYGITFTADVGREWTDDEIRAEYDGVRPWGAGIARVLGGGITPSGAFTATYDIFVMEKTGKCKGCRTEAQNDACGDQFTGTVDGQNCTAYGAFAKSSNHIQFADTMPIVTKYRPFSMAYTQFRNNVVHELAHAFAQLWYKDGVYDNAGPYGGWIPDKMLDNDGFYPSDDSSGLTWRQHPCVLGDDGCAHETFADMALGWTYGMWAFDLYGDERSYFMTTNMAIWISGVP